MAMTASASGEHDLRREAGLAALKERFHNSYSDAGAIREQHGHTTTWHVNQPPDAVIFAQGEGDVVDVAAICAAHGLPIIPFGTGTSLEGHVNAPHGGVSIDMQAMNEVVSVSPEDLICTVQPGVTRKQLNTYLRDTGLFFPIDPGADASLGGMAATRASGTNAVRYGTMKDNVVSLRAVMANGEVMRTARSAKKTSAGYDLTRLMIGSEGTLGIITELTLRLQGIPETIAGGVCPFETIEGATNAVILTIQSGIPVARIEFLDALQVKACNAYSKFDLEEKPTLFVEFHGTSGHVDEQAKLFGEIAADLGGGPFRWETDTGKRNALWQARHDAYWAALQLRPGAKGVATDVCVPISRLADFLSETYADIERSGIIAPVVGHAGDGNFHVLPLIDMDNPAEVEAAIAFTGRLAERALTVDGTCTGEHGIGQGKMKYLRKELGDPAIAAMAAIKTALDPDNILNPGKIFAL